VLGGVIGGALVGLLQWACFRQARARWIQAAALAGAAVLSAWGIAWTPEPRLQPPLPDAGSGHETPAPTPR
ncbi:MAG TPA: hypothetical protein VFP52_08895, partial [Myxococcales bacterium]|nr:hypothetical protein [Myxococcales bacterium]